MPPMVAMMEDYAALEALNYWQLGKLGIEFHWCIDIELLSLDLIGLFSLAHEVPNAYVLKYAQGKWRC